MGEPFQLTYYPGGHQGVKLSVSKTAYEVQAAFAAAAGGNAPALVAMDPDSESVVELEQAAEELKDSLDKTIGTIGAVTTFGANLPRYLLIGGVVLGIGALVGGVVYLAWKHKKRGKKK